MAVAMTNSALSEQKSVLMQTNQQGDQTENTEWIRNPINLPISVYYDSETNILEIWCADDNIQAEVFIFGESGAVEAYSPCMNVTLTLTTSASYSIRLIGDDWEGEGIL